jgi:hypothetical protein
MTPTLYIIIRFTWSVLAVIMRLGCGPTIPFHNTRFLLLYSLYHYWDHGAGWKEEQ